MSRESVKRDRWKVKPENFDWLDLQREMFQKETGESLTQDDTIEQLRKELLFYRDKVNQ